METIGDLEIDQNLKIQHWSWRYERLGWAVIALILILAMLGLFSTGPLSVATAGSLDDGLDVGYQRFLRNNGEASLEIQVAPDQIRNGEITIWINAAYLEKTSQMVIEPEPESIRLDGDRQIFTFPAVSTSEPVRIGISYEPEVIGRIPVEIGSVDGPSVAFTQYCYP